MKMTELPPLNLTNFIKDMYTIKILVLEQVYQSKWVYEISNRVKLCKSEAAGLLQKKVLYKLPYKFYVLGQIGLSKQCRPRSDCF